MENILFFILGGLVFFLLRNKTFKIEIKHIHDDVNKVPVSLDMVEAMNAADTQEDKVYEDMGSISSVMNAIGDIMNGGE